MDYKFIYKKDALKYIREELELLINGKCNVEDARYHHNSSYKDSLLILKYWILSLRDIDKVG